MGDNVKKFAAAAKQRWGTISRKMKMLLGMAVLAVVVVLAVVFLVMSNRPYTVLFNDLTQSDLSAILSYLSDNGVTNYKVEGDSILVPKGQEDSLMAMVLEAGYPTTDYGYSTYLENVGSLTTESERNQLTLYGLQDRMAAVIRNFDGVKDAAVFLTPGEDHTYVLDSGNQIDATATVTVTMEAGRSLEDGQVEAIRNLVSHGLAGLNVENVSISDTYGNTYSAGGDFTNLEDASALKLQLEEKWNNNIRTQIMQALIPLYGADNISVSVNTVVDVDRSYSDSTDYSLEEWAQGKDDGIIGSQIWEDHIVRGTQETTGGEAGTSSNADLDTYVENQANLNGNEEEVSTSGQNDRLVDTDKTQVERIAGYLSDVMVSVTINQDAVGADTNIDSLYSHVARAAGISQEDQQNKISVLIAPFYQKEDNGPAAIIPEEVPDVLIYAAIGVGVLLVLALVVGLLVHRHAKKRREMEQENESAALLEAQMAATAPKADIMDMDSEKSMEMRQGVRKFAEENPEIAAQMVKNWLREGEWSK